MSSQGTEGCYTTAQDLLDCTDVRHKLLQCPQGGGNHFMTYKPQKRAKSEAIAGEDGGNVPCTPSLMCCLHIPNWRAHPCQNASEGVGNVSPRAGAVLGTVPLTPPSAAVPRAPAGDRAMVCHGQHFPERARAVRDGRKNPRSSTSTGAAVGICHGDTGGTESPAW